MRTAEYTLMDLWLQVEEGSVGDDILFRARMYLSLGAEKYKMWKRLNRLIGGSAAPVFDEISITVGTLETIS